MVYEPVGGIGREAGFATQQKRPVPRDRHRPVHGPLGLLPDRVQRIRALAGQEQHDLGTSVSSHRIGQVRGQQNRLVGHEAVHHHIGEPDPGDPRIVVEGADIGVAYLQPDARHLASREDQALAGRRPRRPVECHIDPPVVEVDPEVGDPPVLALRRGL